MQLSDVTGATVITAIGFVLLLCGIFVAVMSAVNAARAEKRHHDAPMEAMKAQAEDHEKRISRCESQLDMLHQKNGQQDQAMKLILKANLALIRHGVDGNNVSGLRDMRDEIQDYLIEK